MTYLIILAGMWQNLAQVLENTLRSAVKPPRQCGFVMPEFRLVLGQDAQSGNTCGLTDLRFSTSCSTRLLENKRVVSKVSIRSMSMGKSASAPLRTIAQTIPTATPFAVERHLAFKAVDMIGFVADTHKAYEAVEKLVTPAFTADSEILELQRSELGALLRTLNKAMREQVMVAEEAAIAAHDALRPEGAAK